jgi:glycosyltransferase involved in cell wall biosynthesis
MVSIAMATYNGAKYIQEQIDSILNQTIQDFELVICDDCSKDETLELLKEYASKDQRIRVYENECNLGFKRNFEKAVALCKGEYIALSDQDDIWMPNHLELLLGAMKNKVLSCGNSLLVNGKGESMGMTWREQVAFASVPETDLGKAMSILLFRNPYQGAAMMIKKELLEFALPIPKSMKYHDTWFAIIACFNGGISCFDTPILKYRRIEESVTGLRKTRISRFNQYRSHFIWGDKLDTIRCVSERLPKISEKEKKFLKKMEKICVRNKTFIGKWLNFIFTTIHYKTIYNSTFNSWK